jgi:hypothetical protein
MRFILTALILRRPGAGKNGDGPRIGAAIFDLRRGWLILLAFLIQLAVVRPITDPSSLGMKRAALAVMALILLLAIIPNLRWWAFRIFAAGFVLNTLVMAANGGLMPVTLENHLRVADAGHQTLSLGQTPPHSKVVLLAPSDTRLRFLSDTIYLSTYKPKIYSLGDLFLMAGLLTFLVEVAVRAVHSRRRSRDLAVAGGVAHTDWRRP